MTKCHIPFSGHYDLDLLPSFKNSCVRCLSPTFFEVGIPNLVCRYILGLWSVAYHFRVTVNLILTSDLVFLIIVSGAYLLYYLRQEYLKFGVWMHLGMTKCPIS